MNYKLFTFVLLLFTFAKKNMDIKDRIQKFIDLEKLTPAQFADSIGVQRSTISHILSGRNNPGYDVLVKILQQYKKLNAEWLILGTGNMIKTIIQTTIPFDQPVENFKVSETDMKRTNDSTLSNLNINSESSISESAHEKDSQFVSDSIQPQNNLKSEKETIKIVFFYNDSTFEIFYPSKT